MPVGMYPLISRLDPPLGPSSAEAHVATVGGFYFKLYGLWRPQWHCVTKSDLHYTSRELLSLTYLVTYLFKIILAI